MPNYDLEIALLITEDDTPVDNIPSAKQQRLLTESLYSSWSGPGDNRTFLAEANIGVFYLNRNPAIVPDMLLSLDVEVDEDWWAKEHRSYFLWEFGKPPDVVVEIVSNKVGKELKEKKDIYARMRVLYYVVFDPQQLLTPEVLTIHSLEGFSYRLHPSRWFPEIGLNLTLWEGKYEGVYNTWLRWTDEHGKLILSGKELASLERAEKEKERAGKEEAQAESEKERSEKEKAQAEKEKAQAEKEKERAEKEAAQQRAEKLAAMLRALGQNPDQVEV
jgi:Uma2 family endonuclease